MLVLLALAPRERLSATDGTVRDIELSGWVHQGPGPTFEPADARIVTFPASGRCEWSGRTDGGGRFSRMCYDVHEGEPIVIAVVESAGQPWEGSVVVPEGAATLALILIGLATPHGPGATPTVTDHLGWHRLRGSVWSASEPLPGVRVHVRGCGGVGLARPMRCLSPVLTDPEGGFEVWCDGGHQLYSSYCVEITHEDYEPYSVRGDVASSWGVDAVLDRKIQSTVFAPFARQP